MNVYRLECRILENWDSVQRTWGKKEWGVRMDETDGLVYKDEAVDVTYRGRVT